MIRGADLSGNLLDALRMRVPAMVVSNAAGGCPRIVFRGQRSMGNQGNPSVYVDGTLMGDTCGLNQIAAGDVDRVEIYSIGNASHPGVQRNPNGLILIFRIQ